MSILNNEVNIISPEKRVANQIIYMASRTYREMVESFNNGSILFWNNPEGLTPEQIVSELGTNAQEVFQLHFKLGELINSIKPDDISTGMSVIGDFVYNDDGSITIIREK